MKLQGGYGKSIYTHIYIYISENNAKRIDQNQVQKRSFNNAETGASAPNDLSRGAQMCTLKTSMIIYATC
jgi:hypothetical protein